MKHINYLQRFKQLEKELSNKEKALDIVRSELMQDMEKSRKVIESASGVKINLCRMPHGIDRPWVNEAAKKNGFVMVNWTYGSDWEKRAEDAQKKDYVNSIKPGAILLFHDGGNKREKTLALTEAVIKAAKEKGYEIVTAGELLGVK
jgi:peptidoglycan/xylan/chitin deacetylase (PgdA/CDA1 family)